MSNPFAVALRADPLWPFGRDDEIRKIVEGICDDIPRSYAVYGPRSLGTSMLLQYLVNREGALKEYANSRKLKKLRLDQVNPIYIDFGEWSAGQQVTSWLVERAFGENEILQKARPKRRKGGLTFPIDELVEAIKRAADEQKQRTLLVFDRFDEALAQLPPEEATRFRPLLRSASVVFTTQVAMGKINLDLEASPLFSYLHEEIYLELLSDNDARAILRKYCIVKALLEDNNLLKLTGTHPILILKGGEVWYNAYKEYGDLSLPTGNFNQIVEDRLRVQLRPYFVPLWGLLGTYYPDQVSTMRSIAEDEQVLGDSEVTPRLSSDLDELQRLGLVYYDSSTRHWKPFSLLWRDFVKETSVESEQLAKNRVGKRSKRNTTKDQLVLRYLRSHPRRLCTHTEIIQAVWRESDSARARHTLRLVIARLRKQLQASQVNEGEIISQRGRGYEYRP